MTYYIQIDPNDDKKFTIVDKDLNLKAWKEIWDECNHDCKMLKLSYGSCFVGIGTKERISNFWLDIMVAKK